MLSNESVSGSDEEAAEALHLLQHQYSKGDVANKLGLQLFFTTHKEGRTRVPKLAMLAMYNGTDEEAHACIEPLRRIGAPDLLLEKRERYIKLNDDLMNLLPGVPSANVFEMKNGGFISKPLGIADWQLIVDQYKRTPNPYNIAYMEVYGGAIGRPSEPNAFIHRDVYMDFYIDSFWQPNTDFTDEPAVRLAVGLHRVEHL